MSGSHAHGGGDVGIEPGIEKEPPAQGASWRLLAAGDDDGSGELAVHLEEIGLRCAHHCSAGPGQPSNNLVHHLGMQAAERSVNFNITVVAARPIADEPVGAQESAEAMPIGAAGRQAIGRKEEHTSELQSLMRNSYAVFCL